MAWSTPRTWAAGETVTAALMNAHLRDNLNVLKTNINDTGVIKTLLSMDGARASSGTGETDAWTYTLPAGTLATNGMTLRLRAWGKGGASGTFTWKLYWDGTSIHTGVVTAASGGWQAEAYIMRTSASAQTALVWSSTLAGGLNTATPVAHPALNTTVWDGTAPTEADLTGAIAMKTTLTASANTLTQLGLILALETST